jgi:hypothetical protein
MRRAACADRCADLTPGHLAGSFSGKSSAATRPPEKLFPAALRLRDVDEAAATPLGPCEIVHWRAGYGAHRPHCGGARGWTDRKVEGRNMMATMPRDAARTQQRTQMMTRGERLAEPVSEPPSRPAPEPSAESRQTEAEMAARTEAYRRGDR